MLTPKTEDRANILDICSHWWINEGYEKTCLDEAEHLANLTPVRLDLLLSLAKAENKMPLNQESNNNEVTFWCFYLHTYTSYMNCFRLVKMERRLLQLTSKRFLQIPQFQMALRSVMCLYQRSLQMKTLQE